MSQLSCELPIPRPINSQNEYHMQSHQLLGKYMDEKNKLNGKKVFLAKKNLLNIYFNGLFVGRGHFMFQN